MSLEQSKQYDRRLNPKDFSGKSAERINRAIPHQAPQRERVSVSTHVRRPKSATARAGSRRSPGKQRGWRDHINPSVNMGVPTLMMILEPNVVWGHSHVRSSSNSRGVEAAACQGYFFDGLDQQSQLSHGVYEGSYWQLLGDLTELEDMLSRMTRAPALLQEPVLVLPPQPELPKWEQYKPEVLTLPDAPPAAADPVLPDFMEPDLPQSVKLSPPQLDPVPPLPAAWKEEVAPEFIPPPAPKIEPMRVPELVLPPAPVHKEPAKPAGSGPPQCGHDWSGKRPFTVPVPIYSPPSLPPEPVEIPEQLPQPELLEAQLQLQPEPLAVLGWAGGPEDPDDDAVIPVLGSAEGANATAAVSTTVSSGSGVAGSAIPSSAGINTVCKEIQAVQQQVKTLATEELHHAWKEVHSLVPAISGAPSIWLDFKAPFAEPPPVLLPPKPEAGPEPQYEPPGELLDLPAYKPPIPQPMPDYNEPPVVLPTWASPCEPLPVGFLRGTAPVLIMDVSGTMHPARRGQFLRVKKCICELLEPDGELATAGSAFDVLAFSGSVWSWSAAYAGKQALIASAMQASNTGRQAGGKQAGQLTQHTSSLARTRTQWQRQQVQQQWQQQQQHRPGSASSGSRNAETLNKGSAAAEGAESAESVENYWQQQQELAVATTPRAVAGTRPGTAALTAGQSRPVTAEAAGSSSPRTRRPMTADSAIRYVTEPLINSPRQQQQQQLGPMLQPADADHLEEARSWVQNWPAAVGNTNLLTALSSAHQYTFTNSSRSPRFGSGGVAAAAAGVAGPNGECSSDSVDCYYLFSDGLADDAAACLQWVQQQAGAGTPLRPVHTVGFFPRNGSPAGERFLSQLATATGGTFQVYNADLPVPAAAAAILRKVKDSSKPAANTEAAADAAEPAAAGVPKVWDSVLGAFVAVDLQNEDAVTRTERRWAEQRLKQRRMHNRRCGRIEPLHTMLESLRQQHQQERVMVAMEQHQQKLLQLKAAHTAACAAVTKANEAAVRQAQREHAVAVQQVQTENTRRVSAAHQAHAAAVQEWKQQFQDALLAWRQAVDEAQAIAAVAAAATETQARGFVPADAADTADTAAPGSKTDTEALLAGQCGSDFIPAARSTNNVDLGLAVAAADSFVIQQLQQQPSSDSSSGSLLSPDLSLALQGNASSAKLEATKSEAAAAAGVADGSAELFAGQSQPQAVGNNVSDAVESHVNSSAKLTLPLPVARDTHSIQNTTRSLSSWSGTPRLPDTAAAAGAVGGGSGKGNQQLQRPSAAAKRPVSAVSAQSDSAGRGAGTKVSVAGSAAASGSGASILANSNNAPAATAAAGSKPKANSRPKSAAARLSADSGNSPAVNANKQKQKSGNSSKSSSGGSSKRPNSGVSLSEPGRLSAATAAAAAAVLGHAVDADGDGESTAKVDSLGDLVSAADDSSDPQVSKQMRRSYTSIHQRDLDIQQQQQQQPAMTQEELVLNRIQSITIANRVALEQIYSEWHTQVVEAEQQNNSALQLHIHESKIHAARHAAYLTQHEAWEIGVQQLQRRAQQEHVVAAARAAAENARLAKLHEQEVADKAAKEAAYAQFISEHAAAHTAAVKQHEAAVMAAKATHEAAVAAAQEVWQQQQTDLEQQYQQQMAAAMQQHTDRVQQIKEQNRLSREAHKEASEAYRAATLGNKRKLALYEEQQREAEEQLAATNAGALQQARQDYKVLCAQLLELHAQQQATAQAEWLASKAAVQQRNAEAIAEARARYAAAVDELLQAHQAVCEQLKQQHEAELTRIRSRNEELRPQALLAQLAATELGRVRAFATHIRACAAKLQLGINFLTETPNLDRVVEMSALTDALRAAFPDVVEPRDYPWPIEELSMQQQPEQQHQESLEGLPAHHQELWSSNSNRGLAVPASPMPAGPGSLAAADWGRAAPRPNTAPAASARADLCSPRSTCSLQLNMQSSLTAGWHVRAPGVVDYKAALQDPALLLRQLQRPRSSKLCPHKDHSRSSSTAGSTRSITGIRRKHMLPGHIDSSPVLAAPVGVQNVMSLQRPHTAPATDQTAHVQTTVGSSLHYSSHTQQHVDKWTLREGDMSGLGTTCSRRMNSASSLGSMSGAGRATIGVPARHAVEHSKAGQRMAQVLVLHGKRQSGYE